ncbi:cell death abnormality protein 1-like isoform X3 [Mya arenaria]|uniref:cell death abnormality protein 1-like isoform X3 n=1 Tax=Mya arenaria TaxID=6604 RepID=UPI0022E74FDF|nr:cell death abnormality protein 1-like isoform X3 [Mya arenaria]
MAPSKKDGMMKMTGGTTLIAFTTLLLTLIFQAWCQDFSPYPCSYKCKKSMCDLHGNCMECADQNFTGSTCDRCIEGKYGYQCDLNCPLRCLSCDSATKCSSCKKGFNGLTCSVKMECPDNCYNDACLSSGICESCKNGFFGHYCNMFCSENCKYSTCSQDGTCINGCKEGFRGARCEQKTCPVNCNQNNRCFGCYVSNFGPSCSLTCSLCKDNECSEHHLKAVKCVSPNGGFIGCIQAYGQFILECETGYQWTDAGCIDASDASPIDKDNGDAAGTSGAAIGGVVGGGVSLLAIALAIGMFIRMWRRRRKDSNGGIEGDARADEEARTYEPLQKRTEQPIYQNANDNGTDNYAVLFADTNF